MVLSSTSPRDGSNTIFRISNESEHVHLLKIVFEHLNYGFQQTDIEHRTQKAFNKLFIKQTWTSFFWTLNRLKRFHLLLIELEYLFLPLNNRTSYMAWNIFQAITKPKFTEIFSELRILHGNTGKKKILKKRKHEKQRMIRKT